MNIGLICEDAYAKQFFEQLFLKMKADEYIERNTKVDVRTAKGGIPKINKAIRGMSRKNDKIILVFDADSQNTNIYKNMEVKRLEAEQQVPKDLKDIEVCMSLNYFEIEEWILYSEGIPLCRTEKPSLTLRERHPNYKKYRLPDYASNLRIEVLNSTCKSFKKFINCLSRFSGQVITCKIQT